MTDGQGTQYDLDSERRLLAACLIDRDGAAIAGETLAAEHLWLQTHQTIYAAIRTLSERGEAVGVQPVLDELRDKGNLDRVGGILGVTKLIGMPVSLEDVEHHARRIRAFALKRSILAAAQSMARVASNGHSPEEVLNKATELWQEAVADSEHPESHSISDLVDELWAYLGGELQATPGIMSGFPDIDAETEGWQPGDLVVVAGAPGLGKTTLLLHFALGAARRGHSVLFVEMEMSHGTLIRRLMASVAKVPEKSLRHPEPSVDIASSVATAADTMRSLPITFTDSLTAPTVPALLAHVAAHRRRKRCDLLIVDQLGNLTPPKKPNRVQEVSALSGGLRDMARRLEIPVVVAHQYSRDGARSEEPTLQDLRDSGSVEQDADIALLMSGKWTDGQMEGLVNVLVGKNRRGVRNKRLQLYFNAAQTRFSSAWEQG